MNKPVVVRPVTSNAVTQRHSLAWQSGSTRLPISSMVPLLPFTWSYSNQCCEHNPMCMDQALKQELLVRII